MVDPILKWAGGKRQLLTEIVDMLPPSWEAYHEPFIGGGAVFLHLCPDDSTINDLNPYLSEFYRVVKHHPDALINENHSHSYKEAYYYDAREEFNSLASQEDLSKTEMIRRASLFLYLNRTGYNGLYRENQAGEFNVPFGRHSDPDFIRASQIRTAHRVLQNTDVYNQDFSYIRDQVDVGDVVYFDPPYEPVSPTANFTEYQGEGFDKDDQKRLRDIAIDLAERGVWVILSNSPPVAELYRDTENFTVNIVEATRRINSDSDNRDEVAEVLISNVPPDKQRRTRLDDFV
jgi:DNA adenine methylase